MAGFVSRFVFGGFSHGRQLARNSVKEGSVMFRLASCLAVLVVLVGVGRMNAELAGNALLFDGANDIAVVPEDDSSLDITSEITVETWVKLLSRDLIPEQVAVHKKGAYTLYPEVHSGGGTGNWKTGLSLWGDVQLFGTTNLVVDTWYHLATTYDGTWLRVFLNGAQESAAAYAGTIRTSDYNLNFGQNQYAWNYPLHGMLDEVRIWDVARTPEELSYNYNRLVDPSTPGLVSYWNFDEEDGQDIYDLTVNANHGYLGRTTSVEVLYDPTRIASDAPIVPEPSTFVLLCTGAVGLLVCGRRRRRRRRG